MLTAATIGLAAYGLFEAGWALFDVVARHRLELWADGLIVLFGLLLLPAAAFVRVRLPGGLALAIGGLLALQALSIHTAAHLYGRVSIWLQIARGLFAGTLVLLAYLGSSKEH
jgi:hypothetical protein